MMEWALEKAQFVPLYLIAPPCDGVMEGFPGALTVLKNYLDYTLGSDNPSFIIDLEDEHLSDLVSCVKREIPVSYKIIVGITATTATYQRAIKTAKCVKKTNPHAITIIGGHHVKDGTAQEKVILERHADCVDYVCISDGEKTLKALMEDRKDSDVPNTAFIRDGQLRYGRTDDLSVEEWDKIPFRIYQTKSKKGKFDEGASYVSARGCNYKCAFCSVSNDPIRGKSEGRIIEDLREIVVINGIKKIAFENNFFSQNVKSTYDLARRIINERRNEPRFDFEWTCQTRVEYLSNDKIALNDFIRMLADSGATKIYLGIENFDPKILLDMAKVGSPIDISKLDRKGLQSRLQYFEQNYLRKAMEDADAILSYPVELGILFIVGRLGEDEITEKINLIHLEELGRKASGKLGTVHVYQSLSVVYPGTYDAQKLLRITDPAWETLFEDYTIWEENSSDPERRRLADFITGNFAHGAGGVPWGILDLEAMKNREFHVNLKELQRVERYLGLLRKLQERCPIEIHSYVEDLQ